MTARPRRRPGDEVLAERGYIEGTCALAGLQTGGRAVRRPGVVVVETGLPSAEWNVAHVTASHALAVAAALRLAERHFRERDLPFTAVLRSEAMRHARRLLARPDALELVELPAMVRDLTAADAAVPPHPRLSLHPVRRGDATAFAGLLAAAFDDDVLPAAYPPHRFDGDAVRAFLGCVDGEPVATGALVRVPAGVAIHDISVAAAHRGRGYATAMTRHLCALAAAGGHTEVTLQASPLGRPVYERLGFRTVAVFRRVAVDRALAARSVA